MNGYVFSAALGAAMELGVFWLLAEKPLTSSSIAQTLHIPLNRCHIWLQLLCKLGLLEENVEGYFPSRVARETILNSQSQDTWAFQAREERQSFRNVQDLAVNLSLPISSWEVGKRPKPDYFRQFQEDPGFSASFTRKLCEIHKPLAEQLANMLDLMGIRRLLDLGGGSGVISFALLRKQPELSSVVVDVDNVCKVGREIAVENKLDKRISYIAHDFLQNDILAGFDMVLLCDVGIFDHILFQRIHTALNDGGRLVIVDKFAPSNTCPPPSRIISAFLSSMELPADTIDFTTLEKVQNLLHQTGFRDFSISTVPPTDTLPWNLDWTILDAHKVPTG